MGAAEPRYVLQSPGLVENCVGLYVPLLEFNLHSWQGTHLRQWIETDQLGILPGCGRVLHRPDPSFGRRSLCAQVGGPEALSPLEVVRIFEEESGRRFEVEKIPEAKLREQFNSANDSLEKSFAGIMLQYAHGDSIDMRRLLESIPVRLTSVQEYARTVLEPYKRAAL